MSIVWNSHFVLNYFNCSESVFMLISCDYNY